MKDGACHCTNAFATLDKLEMWEKSRELLQWPTLWMWQVGRYLVDKQLPRGKFYFSEDSD